MKQVLLYVLLSCALFGLPFMAYTSEEHARADDCRSCHTGIAPQQQDVARGEAFDGTHPRSRTGARGTPACTACHGEGSSIECLF